MRRLFVCLLCGIMAACSSVSNYHQQLEQVEEFIEDHPDSAKALLEEIPASLLGEGEEKALYNMLLTMANYKLYHPFSDDSLIRYSVNYYEPSNNHNRLATAYYYIGAINFVELKNKDVAIHFLKKAEELAHKGNDELQKNKLYELLQGINYDSGNYLLALHYAKQLLRSSQILDDPILLARSYDHLSNDYLHLGMQEQADSCIKKSLNYASQCNNRDQGYIYGNYANSMMGRSKYKEAQQFLEKAIEKYPLPNHYIMLGKISKREDDTLKARMYWEKVMTFHDLRFSISAYKLLAEMYSEQGNYPMAFQMLDKADSVKDAHHEQMRTTQLAEIQHRYNTAITEKALTERKNFWLNVATAALVVLILALLAVIYYSRRVTVFKGIIDQNIEQIYQAEQKIEQLQSSGKDSEHEIKMLKEQIGRLTDASAHKLGRGKGIYDIIINNGKLINFTKTQEQNFIDYYAFTFSEQFHTLLQTYKSLTLRHTTYLVLRQMGVDDKKIGELLHVSDSTIRNYRHRLKLQK